MKRRIFNFCLMAILAILFSFGTESVFSQNSIFDPKTSGNLPLLSKPKLYIEKSIYKLSDNVAIRGEGFQPFEPVKLTIRRTDNSAVAIAGNIPVAEWILFADETGKFTTDWAAGFYGSRFLIEAVGQESKASANIDFVIETHLAHLDQCRNGTFDVPLVCTGANWVNGDLNGSQAHYVEGESVPYRMILENLDTAIPHTVTIEFDTTEGGKHAIDYLTTFNRTETTAAPCSDIAGCDPAAFDTEAIPVDANVVNGFDGAPGTSDDITQIAGNFTLYGGTITAVSGYDMTGNFAGTSQTRIIVMFTTTVTNPVLAWGGHIASRQDWGTDYSAIAINGAPYHMRIYDVDGEGGGNQDRSLQSGAVIYPGKITIRKDAQPDSTQVFGFTVAGPAVSDFSLDDDGTITNTYSNTKDFNNLTNFGTQHAVTISENGSMGSYLLTNILCTSDVNGGTGTNNNNISIPNRQVEIMLEEGEYVNCAFINTRPTAAAISVSGQVVSASGRGISGVRMTLLRVYTGETFVSLTNPFGYYNFQNVPAGEGYVITVNSKRYVFNPGSMAISPVDDVLGLNFQAEPL